MSSRASKVRTCTILFFLFFTFSFRQGFAQGDKAISPIYTTDTIVWFGIDFSLFRLSEAKKIGKEDEIRPHIANWVSGYNQVYPNVKMASMLKRKKVWLDTTYTARAYTERLPNHFIQPDPYAVNDEDLADYIEEIPTNRTGIGLIYIVENLFKGEPGPGDEIPSEVRGSFVWFDIGTREVLLIQPSIGTPNTVYFTGGGGNMPVYGTVGKRKGTPQQRGFEGYWLQGMIDATSAFTLEYKDNLPKTNTQY